jgi:hypothetical protein
MRRAVAAAQSFVYVTSGVWPILSLRTFELVTGRKRDKWLVQTMGAFIAAVGVALGVAARKRRVAREAVVLGVASAATLAVCDVVFVKKVDLRRVYLIDAIVEGAFVAGWLLSGTGRHTREQRTA